MNDEHQQSLDNRSALLSLWLGWTLSTGALLAVVLAPLLVPPLWVPFVAILLEASLFLAERRNRESALPKCYLLPFIAERVLLWSAILMMALVIYLHILPPARQGALPFIPVLIVSPLTFIITLWRDRAGLRFPYCRGCILRNGSPVERGFWGKQFTREGSFQCRMLMLLSLFVSIVSSAYYFIRYVNVSINEADRYFFFLMPTAIYVLSVIYITIRYLGMLHYYDQDVLGSELRRGRYTELRFILVWSNYIFVRFIDPASDQLFNPALSKGDTPATLSLQRRRDIHPAEAMQFLNGILPMVKNPELRHIFTSTSTSGDSNTFHYFVFLDDADHDAIQQAFPGGTWLTLSEINRLNDAHQLEPAFASELHRVITMVMARKTYTREGKRLYPVKHYRPTFRIEDLRKYDVDYSDRRWLYVADDNADRRFFRLRSWWRRHIQGKDY